MTMTPFPFQVDDVAKLRANNYTGLLAIDPGGTKTRISTMAAHDAGTDVNLVIAPLGTHESAWAPTILDVTGKELRRIGNGTKSERAAKADFEFGFPGWYAVTPQLLTRADTSSWYADMMITDEAHVLSMPRSAGQRKWSGYSFHDGTPLAKRAGARLALSGTPFRRDMSRAWSIMRFLWPDLFEYGSVAYDNWYSWCEFWLKWEYDPFSPSGRKYSEEKNPGALLDAAPCVIRHFRRDRCCAHHPQGFLSVEEPQVLERIVPLLPAQRKAVTELEETFMTWLDENPLVTDISLTQKQRIRQVCLGVPKVDLEGSVSFSLEAKSPMIDEVFNILSEVGDEPVVIFLSSQQFATVLTHRLNERGISAFEFSGATVSTREENLRMFGTRFRVAVITYAAGSTGLDGLQRVASTDIYLDQHVDDVLMEQSESRADRLGVAKQVQRFVISDDMGYSRGVLSANMEKRLKMARSTRAA